mmetsp:Transcript_14614/g.2398  ORF Transcript_14614/g.2398 Transcript_14614/m.2398 type:complete len:103 (-) Transcript_14614:8-316(-)
MEVKTIYSLDDMIVSVMIFKVYHLARTIVNMQNWITVDSIRICNYHSTDANAFFALKCTLKTHPFYASGIIFMICAVLFGIILRIYERAYPGSSYEYIWNGF